LHPRFHAQLHPDKPAVTMSDTGETLTYGSLEEVANRGAHFLRSLGIASGDTVAAWLPNTPRYFEFYWAAQRAGLYIAPISTALTAEEAAYILADCGARLLLTAGGVAAAARLLAAQRRSTPTLAHVLWADSALPGYPCWNDAIANQPATPIGDEQAGFHMVYSSGTTGRPKGVRLKLTGGPATEEHSLAVRQRETYGVGPDTVYLSPAPLYHTAPLAFTTTAHRLGAPVVVMPKFDAEAALAAIERYRANFVQMVPTMFIRLLRLPEAVRRRHDLSSLRIVLHAAAPCPVEVKRQMIDWLGPIIFEYYGGSEGNGATFITSEEWLRKPGSVGRASWGSIHVCGDDGSELPPGTPGLIYFEGGWDFQYLNDPQKTRDSRHPDHVTWSTLGDIGYVDADGYLFLTDRRSFVIISGGVNIYPQEAENLLSQHPGIADVAVIGVPHPEMGEEVKAVVQPLEWLDATAAFADEIMAYCRAQLSPIKCPRSVDFVQALPRQETGKLHKRLIRDRYWANPSEGAV
jgi:long-chain acyl-CoA synthetase